MPGPAKEQMTWEQLRVRRWITSNKGVMTQISLKCDCSIQYVNQIAYGISDSLPGSKVESELRRAGWPGILRTRRKR